MSELMLSKSFACQMAWIALPGGEYSAQDIADKANEMGLSDRCYAEDARNMLRRYEIPVLRKRRGAGRSVENVYQKEHQV